MANKTGHSKDKASHLSRALKIEDKLSEPEFIKKLTDLNMLRELQRLW